MDHVIDSASCTDCGHPHWPEFVEMMHYDERRDECCEPGCDCTKYEAPELSFLKVKKCSSCGRMVTRVWASHSSSGYTCGECHSDD